MIPRSSTPGLEIRSCDKGHQIPLGKRGPLIRALDFQSGGPVFDSFSLPLDWFVSGCTEFKSYTLLNSQLVCLLPVGILNHVIAIRNNLFPLFQWYAWKVAVQAKCFDHHKRLHLHLFYIPRFDSCQLTTTRTCNRLFAWHGHVTLSIIKNGRGTEQMPEIKRACQKY